MAISVLGVAMLIATVVVAVGLLGTPSGKVSTLTGEGGDPLLFMTILFAGLWLYWGLGALIVVRADGHLVGWLFAVAAAMVASVFECYALGFLLISSQPPDPLGSRFVLLGGLLNVPAVILILPAVALYDAQRTVDAFAEQLRNEVDLARLRATLLATADDAVRPVSATVWLRDGAEASR